METAITVLEGVSSAKEVQALSQQEVQAERLSQPEQHTHPNAPAYIRRSQLHLMYGRVSCLLLAPGWA